MASMTTLGRELMRCVNSLTKSQIGKPSEHDEQRWFFDACNVRANFDRRYALPFAVPNGAKSGQVLANGESAACSAASTVIF